MVELNRKDREAYVAQRLKKLSHDDRQSIGVEVSGRPKTYLVFIKLINKNMSFHELYDLLGIRIIVDNVPDCYKALGLIHENINPYQSDLKITSPCQSIGNNRCILSLYSYLDVRLRFRLNG